MNIEHRLERIWEITANVDGEGDLSGLSSPEFDILTKRWLGSREPDWTEGTRHLHLGIHFRSENRIVDALEEFCLAYAYTAPATELLLNLIATLMQVSDLSLAERWARRMLINNDSGDVHLHLALIVWNQGRHNEALAICRDMVSKYPHHLGVVPTAAMLYLAKGLASEALIICLEFLSSDIQVSASIYHVYDLTIQAAISSGQYLPSWCLAQIHSIIDDAEQSNDQIRNASAMLDLREAANAGWQFLFTFDAPDDLPPPSTSALLSAPQQIIQKLCHSLPPAELVSLHDFANLERLYDGAVTRPDCLEAEGFDYSSESSPLNSKKEPLIYGVPVMTGFSDPIRKLQLDIVSNGMVTMLSPFGDRVSSASSIVVHYKPEQRLNGSVICYAVREPRMLFIIFATETIWPIAWYDPICDIILQHEGMMNEGFQNFTKDIVSQLKFVMLCNLELSKRYLLNDVCRRGRSVNLLFGTLDYLSTHILDLQGFQNVVAAGLSSSLNSILVTAPEPLGVIEEYFPTYTLNIVDRQPLANVIELNKYLWNSDAVSVRVTGGVVTQALADRVVSRATAMTDPSWKQQVDGLKMLGAPVIFVALRAMSRKWLVEPADIANIFNILWGDYPHMSIIFDGYCAIGSEVPTQVSDDLILVESIKKSLLSDIRTLIVAGKSMEDSIYAACQADVHLSSQGTTATKSVLIAGKPGVVIGSSQFAIDLGVVRAPRPNLITLKDQSRDAMENNAQCNFWLEPAIVLESLRVSINDCLTQSNT